MSFRFVVERGAIAQFARALGDDDPRWWDEDSPEAKAHGGVTAPPTFVSTTAHWDPDWPYRPRPGVPWHGSGRQAGQPPPGIGAGTSMHAEQHYTFHRPLRPGDVLTVERSEGRNWQKESARAGTLSFSEEITTYTDETGEVVATAIRVRVITSKKVDP